MSNAVVICLLDPEINFEPSCDELEVSEIVIIHSDEPVLHPKTMLAAENLLSDSCWQVAPGVIIAVVLPYSDCSLLITCAVSGFLIDLEFESLEINAHPLSHSGLSQFAGLHTKAAGALCFSIELPVPDKGALSLRVLSRAQSVDHELDCRDVRFGSHYLISL